MKSIRGHIFHVWKNVHSGTKPCRLHLARIVGISNVVIKSCRLNYEEIKLHGDKNCNFSQYRSINNDKIDDKEESSKIDIFKIS